MKPRINKSLLKLLWGKRSKFMVPDFRNNKKQRIKIKKRLKNETY